MRLPPIGSGCGAAIDKRDEPTGALPDQKGVLHGNRRAPNVTKATVHGRLRKLATATLAGFQVATRRYHAFCRGLRNVFEGDSPKMVRY